MTFGQAVRLLQSTMQHCDQHSHYCDATVLLHCPATVYCSCLSAKKQQLVHQLPQVHLVSAHDASQHCLNLAIVCAIVHLSVHVRAVIVHTKHGRVCASAALKSRCSHIC
jgi:hypothetical protein